MTSPVLRISRTFTFSAAHHLPLVPPGHKCRRVHGHNYEVTVYVEGCTDARGWVEDYGGIDAWWERHVRPAVDHCDLNTVIANPTAELLAIWFFEQLEQGYGSMAVAVEVRENARSCARYERAD